MAKMRYFKLGPKASAFYDSKSKLKINHLVPGRVLDKLSKSVDVARTTGHITEIEKSEYDKMINALPSATKKAVMDLQNEHAPLPKVKEEAPEEVADEELEIEEEPVEEEEEIDPRDEEEEETEEEDKPKKAKKKKR